jgi:uncharacterized membrane protein
MKLSPRSPLFWVILSAIGFLLFYGIVIVFRYKNFFTAHYDLGNMVQVMWHTLHGRIFGMFDAKYGVMGSRAVYHADYLLLIYTPLYALISHPLTLCLAQLVLVVSGVFPLYWFARRRLPEWIAATQAIRLPARVAIFTATEVHPP